MQVLNIDEIAQVSGGTEGPIAIDPVSQWAIDVFSAWNSFNWSNYGEDINKYQNYQTWYDQWGNQQFPKP